MFVLIEIQRARIVCEGGKRNKKGGKVGGRCGAKALFFSWFQDTYFSLLHMQVVKVMGRCVGGHLGLGELDPHRAPVRREQELALEGAHGGRRRRHVSELDERNRHGGGGCGGHVVVVEVVVVDKVGDVVVGGGVVVVTSSSSVSVHSGSSSSIGSSDGGALTVHTEATKARQTVDWLIFGVDFG